MTLPAVLAEDGRWFRASCPVLDVHSQGTTEQEALKNLIEAIQLFVETCYGQGTLEQVLIEQGFEPGASDDEDASDELTVEVPISLIVRQHAEARAN